MRQQKKQVHIMWVFASMESLSLNPIWVFGANLRVYRYGCGNNYIKQQMKTLETFSNLYVVLLDAKAKDIYIVRF